MSFKHAALAAALALAGVSHANAATIAFTSFEEPGSGAQYVDTGDASVDHALMNNDGQAPVNYAGGAELGFSSFYTNTRGEVGLTDGDFVGVTDFTGTVGAFTDGDFGFQISDADGLMTTQIDAVSLLGFDNTMVSLDFFVQDTGYESTDRARIWVEVDGGLEIDLFTASDSELEGRGLWETVMLDLSGFTTATLFFELDSNSSSESLYVDNILFSGDASAVPLPAAVWLFGAALAGLGGFRRRA